MIYHTLIHLQYYKWIYEIQNRLLEAATRWTDLLGVNDWGDGRDSVVDWDV